MELLSYFQVICLDELSQIATHYGILHDGKLISELSKEELASETRQYIELETTEVQKAVVVLDELGIKDYEVINGTEINIYEHLDDVAAINRSLVLANVNVLRIGTTRQKLEDYFLQLTGGNLMLNLLTAEKIKLFRSKKLWIVLAILFLLPIIK